MQVAWQRFRRHGCLQTSATDRILGVKWCDCALLLRLPQTRSVHARELHGAAKLLDDRNANKNVLRERKPNAKISTKSDPDFQSGLPD